MDEPRQNEDRLTSEGLLPSDLWVDAPDALERIDLRLNRGELDEERAEKLRHFVEKGYLVLDLDLAEEIYESFDASVAQLWKEKPSDVAFSYRSPLQPFSLAVEERDRRPSYRISDLHSYCDAALDLYLNRTIFDYLYLIFEDRPVATQSLYFEFGSQQHSYIATRYTSTCALRAIWWRRGSRSKTSSRAAAH